MTTANQFAAPAGPIRGAGVSLKAEHYEDVLALPQTGSPDPGTGEPWFEVHTENYFVAGGPRLDYLSAIRERHQLSFHGVGASLGSLFVPDTNHLDQVKALVDRFQPALVSEHAVWSRAEQTYFADLLPLPRTQSALQQLIDGIDRYQTHIGRRILIENPANYLDFKSEMDEPDFLVEAAQRAGCGLLVDVNNLYLSGRNIGIDTHAYVSRIPAELVGELHVAGHDPDPQFGARLLIDSHAAEVALPVWELLAHALERFGDTPVCLERDARIPPFADLMRERLQAQHYMALCPTTRARV